MKNSFRAIVAVALAAGFTLPAFADDVPEAGAAPKRPVQTKGAAQPAAAESKAAPIYHPEPAVAKQANVNIRGQAKLNSEVVGHLKKGDAVTILEEINLKNAKQDEPSRWYRVILPAQMGAWVHSSFIADGAVKATRLNLRGGPGEEYSVLGRIEKGTPVKQLDTKGDWTKIEAPTNAHGFVAAHLLERVPTAAIAAVTPKPEETPAPPVTPVAPPPITETVKPETPPALAETPTAPVTPTPTTPAVETPAPVPIETAPDEPIEKVKKVVTREGFLRGSVSIQAPTYFELRSLDTGKSINYVFSPSTNLMLRDYKGKRIIVTGEELLDERWQNTPVLIVDTLQTVE